MSGVTLITRIDLGETRSVFQRLALAVADTTPIMRAIGTGLQASTHDRFDAAQDPEGNAWALLNPLYAATKRGPGILRESAMRGGLQGSITYAAGRAEVRVGTNKIYGSIHQGGGVIKAKNGRFLIFRVGGKKIAVPSVTIPARPYLGISADDQVMIMDVVEGALARAVGSGPSSGTPRR